ncbi:CRC domain-containing protein TSO1, partial [Bienertia sinuspersici]
DSPVFNYINTLSPIKPFSLGHNTQPFHLFNFSSPQALQTPPTNPKESKIPRAISVTDVPKNNYSENESEGKNAENPVAIKPANLHTEEVDNVNKEVSVSTIDESSKSVSDFPTSFKYECDASENNVVYCNAVKPCRGVNMAGTELFPVKAIQNNYKKPNCSFENEMGVQAIQMEQNKENCHDELDDRNADSRMLSFVSTVLQPPNEQITDSAKVESPFPKSENYDMEVPLNKSGDVENPNERIQLSAGNPHAVLSEVVHYMRTEVDDKSCSQQQQTTRRRCLVYEMSGSHYRKLLSDSTGNSPTNLAASSNASNDKSVMVNRPVGNRFSSALPSIGLHLNALAAASKDKIIVKRQTLTCRRQLIKSPCTTTSFDSVVPDKKPLTTQIAPEAVEREPGELKDGVQLSGDVSENSFFGEGIDFPPSSPKKKRRKSETVGEPDSCKRCNCKRSKCLKLYCECFAAGLYCVETCNCQDCFNKPAHEETVIETRRQIESRNPLAFAPKVIRCSDTPNSAGGVGCSLSCRCEGCKNTFGRKEGTENFIYREPQFSQLNASDTISHDDEENHDQVTPNPAMNARQPVRESFHFNGKTPHLPAHPSGSVLQSCTAPSIDQSDQTAFEEDIKSEIQEDGNALEAFKGDYSLLTTCVKSTSPNCKRISPPHCYFETSPGWRSCRKLILRSIPSVPTSTPENESTELPRKL